MKLTRGTILALSAILILGGCSHSFKANRHLRLAKKHILKAESFGGTWSADTIYKNIPVFVPQIKHDTIITSQVGDTVRIIKDRLQVKYVRLAGDSVFIEGTCQSDTIYTEVPVTITKTIKTADKWKFPALALGGILIALILALLFFARGKRI